MYRGELVNECIPIAGRPSCKVADGSWQPCADGTAGNAAMAAPAAGDATVTASGPATGSGQAVTVDGEACILPSVSDETPSHLCGQDRD